MQNNDGYTRKTFLREAYFVAWRVLDGSKDVVEALFEAYDGIDGFLQSQRKNRDKNSSHPTTAPFNSIDTFQFLLYEKLESFEKKEEEAKLKKGELINARLLLLRYVKSVIYRTVRRRPFHLVVALCSVIYDIDWKTALKIHDTVMQTVDTGKDQNEFNLQRRSLKDKQIKRFSSSLLEIETDGNGMKEFSLRTPSDVLLTEVQNDLTLCVPWQSECFELDDGSRISDKLIPALRSFSGDASKRGYDGLLMSIWRNRHHALIHPTCFDKIINSFGLQPLTAKLQIPNFKQTESGNKMNDDSDAGSGKMPQEPTPEFFYELFNKQKQREHRRRKLKTKMLTVIVDGVARSEYFNVEESGSFNLTVPSDTDTIELFAHDEVGLLPMAELSLEFYADELEENPEISFAVTREAGQNLEILVRTSKTTGEDESYYYNLVINYSEKNPIRACSLSARRWLHRLPNIREAKLKTIGALAVLTIISLLSAVAVIYFSNRAPELVVIPPENNTQLQNNSDGNVTVVNKNNEREVTRTPEQNNTPFPLPNTSPTKTERATKPLYVLNDASGTVFVDTDGSFVGLTGYDKRIQEISKRALINGQIKIPELDEISPVSVTQMGEGSQPKSFTLSPNGQVVRSDRPIFSWEKYTDAESYTVKVFDSNYDEVANSGEITMTEWIPAHPLARGQIYSWELNANLNGKTVKLPEKVLIRFKVLDEQIENSLRAAEAVKPQSRLVLGVLYARAGLFNEAEREFRILLKSNPNSPQVRNLLNNVRRRRYSERNKVF